MDGGCTDLEACERAARATAEAEAAEIAADTEGAFW